MCVLICMYDTEYKCTHTYLYLHTHTPIYIYIYVSVCVHQYIVLSSYGEWRDGKMFTSIITKTDIVVAILKQTLSLILTL